MRKRTDIEKDGSRPEFLILEVLLDIRDKIKSEVAMKKRGRPRKNKSSTEGRDKGGVA